jgi:aspartate/methionine/tyrosine aminotransferase
MGLAYFRPDGTFYVFLDISAAGLSSAEFSRRLLDEARVFVYPGVAFGPAGEGYVRVSLLAPTPRLLAGLDRLEQFFHQRSWDRGPV